MLTLWHLEQGDDFPFNEQTGRTELGILVAKVLLSSLRIAYHVTHVSRATADVCAGQVTCCGEPESSLFNSADCEAVASTWWQSVSSQQTWGETSRRC